jgi:hypothetical protein
MELRELGFSITTMMTGVVILYLALGAVNSYSGENEVKHRVALSPDAAQYIYLRN